MKRDSLIYLVLFILAAEGAGLAGLFFMGSIDEWYMPLAKPLLNPPTWLFGPAWTALYALMGTAAFLVWRQKIKSNTLYFYWTQLVVNALWTPLFFGLKNPELALVDIAILLTLIILTIVIFFKVNKTASILLVPYLFWVCFATYLNLMIVLLN